MLSHKISVELTEEQLVDVVAALNDAASYRNNLARMWKYDVDPTLPRDRAIAEEYARENREKADAFEDLADLFNRAYYEN